MGEASHPGPEQEVFRVPEDVLDDLEAALTRIDSSGSDDEPLVRPPSGRNVMGSQEVRHTPSVRSWQSAQVMWSSEADDEGVSDQSNCEGHCRRPQSGLNTQGDSSDSQAPMVRSGRFAALSHVSEEELAVAVRSNRREEHHRRVAVQSGGVSRGFKRLRRAHDKRVSQATTIQADMADVVEFDLIRCDSDLEAVSEHAKHEQNDLTLIDSSDDDFPFTVPRPTAPYVRLSRRWCGS